MGRTPIAPYRPPRPPSRLEAAKTAYVEGRISLEELEGLAEQLIRDGTEDAPQRPGIPLGSHFAPPSGIYVIRSPFS